MADTFHKFGNNAAIISLLVITLTFLFIAADFWFEIPAMVEEVMVVLIIVPIGLMSRKWGVAPKKAGAKKEISSIANFAKDAPTKPGHPSKLAQADNDGEGDASEMHHASSVAGSFTLRLREFARARDLVGLEQLAKEMRIAGIKPTVTCYGVVIDAFAKAGDSVGAERWLADSRKQVWVTNQTLSW